MAPQLCWLGMYYLIEYWYFKETELEVPLGMLKWKYDTVFKIRSETCRTEAQFCENLYMIKKESLPNLAGPTQILLVNVRGPALILKTDDINEPSVTCGTRSCDFGDFRYIQWWKLCEFDDVIFTGGQFWPSGIVIACVCICTCLSAR